MLIFLLLWFYSLIFMFTRCRVVDSAEWPISLQQPELWLCFYWIHCRRPAWGVHLKYLCNFLAESWQWKHHWNLFRIFIFQVMSTSSTLLFLICRVYLGSLGSYFSSVPHPVNISTVWLKPYTFNHAWADVSGRLCSFICLFTAWIEMLYWTWKVNTLTMSVL